MMRAVFLMLTLLLLAAACTNGREAASASTPPDLRIILGTTEGPDLVRGFTVHADGAILNWYGRQIGASATRRGTISGGDLEALWNRIDGSGFFESARQQEGHTMRFLMITANGYTRKAQWVIGPSIPRPDDALFRLADAVEETIASNVDG